MTPSDLKYADHAGRIGQRRTCSDGHEHDEGRRGRDIETEAEYENVARQDRQRPQDQRNQKDETDQATVGQDL